MVKVTDLSLAKLKHRVNLEGSQFFDLYSKLMRRDSLTEAELIDVLRFSILFMRMGDDVVSRLGYRMILQYGEITRDYEPLHRVARNRELMPVVAAAERIQPDLDDSESFSSLLFGAHQTNFLTGQNGQALLRTRGQMELRAFNARTREGVVVAPTSYGKSEMLIEKIVSNLNQKSCILVPTRALISQTRAQLIGDPRLRASRVRLLTHPDAYANETRFVAVMTQERLHRLFVDRSDLVLDMLLVDEAQNLLPDTTRAVQLSQAVLTARRRNPDLALTYYTPFMSEPHSLRHVNGVDERLQVQSVNEHVKAERIVVARASEQAALYDQFLDRMIPIAATVPSDELSIVTRVESHRTLVYVNRPRDAQDFAERLADRLGRTEISPEAERAVRAIGDLIDPSYSLARVIQAGVLFHHGQVPDVLRQYIERLFSQDSSNAKRILVTTSTLLEGVNTPADCLIVATPQRGRGYLSRSAFRNLIGRVGRFREVFDPSRENLDLLQPRIYLVPTSYAPSNWNIERFLSNVANLARVAEDDVENPLLEGSQESPATRDELEYLENIEPGASLRDDVRIAATEVGRLCFANGVRDFDIFAHETEMQSRVDAARSRGWQLEGVRDVVDAIQDFFLESAELINSDDLARIRDSDGARQFYSMFIEWRSQNEPFKRLISRFVRYWSQLEDELVFVGQRWGEVSTPDGFARLYVRMAEKTRDQMVNLAVVKIKEEQDFVDFRLMKYVEVLNSLDLVDDDLYNEIKFGSADPYLICLLRNGFSPELARVIVERYSNLVRADVAAVSVEVDPGLPTVLEANGENDIIVYEALTLVPPLGR